MAEWVDGWMDGWMDGRTDRRTDGGIGGWMDGWTDGRTGAWVGGGMEVVRYRSGVVAVGLVAEEEINQGIVSVLRCKEERRGAICCRGVNVGSTTQRQLIQLQPTPFARGQQRRRSILY